MPQNRVFISYAKADAKKAGKIAVCLEERGVTCWIALRDVKPGAAYGDEIIRGIETSPAFVLILSGASNECANLGPGSDRRSVGHQQSSEDSKADRSSRRQAERYEFRDGANRARRSRRALEQSAGGRCCAARSTRRRLAAASMDGSRYGE